MLLIMNMMYRLIEIEIVNYNIEANFDYQFQENPFFDCDQTYDYEKMLKIYLNYLHIFEENYRSREQMNTVKDYYYVCVRLKDIFYILYYILFRFFRINN